MSAKPSLDQNDTRLLAYSGFVRIVVRKPNDRGGDSFLLAVELADLNGRVERGTGHIEARERDRLP